MKKMFLFMVCCAAACFAHAQNRNATVTALNNYVLYVNANNTALSLTLTSLDRYNGLFNDYVRLNRELGGEPYEKPKASPFVDADVFTMNQDDPETLYKNALKGSAALPAAVKDPLNKNMLEMRDCSRKIVLLIDSMSNLFSAKPIAVTKNPAVLPFRLLAEAGRQLERSKKLRNELLNGVSAHYNTACKISASKGDYIFSADSLRRGLYFCQYMMDQLRENRTTVLADVVAEIDSLCARYDRQELVMLKGIKPYGDSKHFPNKSNYNGFDLYAKYEDIIDQFRLISAIGKKFLNDKSDLAPAAKFAKYHEECVSRFNSTLGLLYYYNEYMLLIGGGKMKIKMDNGRYVYKGWGDESHSLPVRTQLFGMKETPRYLLNSN
jgi:hypothetical protein